MAKILEIRLDAGSLDLNPESAEKFYINKQIHDLRDLQTRNASNSKQISIPLTPNNLSLLGVQVPVFMASSFSVVDFISCDVYMFGHPVMRNAKLLVGAQSELNKTVNISIFSGSVVFFDELSDNGISELNWNEYNFNWDVPNLAPYVNTTSGLLMADTVWSSNESYTNAINNGVNEVDSKLSIMDTSFSGAWMYAHTIIEKILSSISDITFDTSLIEDDLYNSIVVGIPSTQAFESFTGISGTNGLVSQTDLEIPFLSHNTIVNLTWDTVESDEPPNFYNTGTDEYDVVDTGFYDVILNINYRPTSNLGSFVNVAVIAIRVDDVIVKQQVVQVAVDKTVELKTTVPVISGQKVRVTINRTDSVGNFFTLHYSGTFSCALSGSTANKFVQVGSQMPDISQKDFIKEIFNIFNIVLDDTEQNNIVFHKWDDIPASEEVDLTVHLDESREIESVVTLSGYAQNNKFKYSVHDTVKLLGTDYDIKMQNNALQDSVDKIVSKFTPSDAAQNVQGNSRISTPLFPYEYSSVTDNKIKITNNQFTYETTERNSIKAGDILLIDDNGGGLMRRKVVSINTDFEGIVDVAWTTGHDSQDWEHITYSKQDVGLLLGLAEDNASMSLQDGGTIQSFVSSKRVTFPPELNWTGLVESNYRNFEASIVRPYVIRVWVRLPVGVFSGLNSLKPVYLRNEKFYLNKVEQYNTTNFTRLELIKVNSVKKQDASLTYAFTVTPTDPLINMGDWITGDSFINLVFILENTGTADLIIHPTIGGLAGQYFERVNTDPVVLSVGAQVGVGIRFNGSEQAGINLADVFFQEQFAPNVTRQVYSNVSVIKYSVLPTTLDFEDVAQGNTKDLTVIITNDGSESLTFDWGGNISGADASEYSFVFLDTGVTLAAGETHDLVIRFTANAPKRLKVAELLIECTNPAAPNTVVDLLGVTV